MNKTEFKIKSVDGVTDLHVIAWLPSEENVVGVIQIAHGITEHMGRYEKFAMAMLLLEMIFLVMVCL